jgi:ATP-dependent exoDNAse (exonuclease V) beta subunit
MGGQNPQIISVSASAGSGKTYALAKRYIELLFENPLKSVIAMTFANKAAVEMKYRAIEYLKKGALGLDAQDVFKDLSDVKEKSAEILKAIFENYDNFNIGTIDSFKNFILKACAINLNMSPNYSIETKYEPYLALSVDAFIKEAAENISQKQTLIEYLDQYILSEKSGWFAKDDIFNEAKKVFDKASSYGKEIAQKGDISFSKLLPQKAQNLYELSLKLSEAIQKLNVHKNIFKTFEKIENKGFLYFQNSDDFSIYLFKPEINYNKNAQRDDRADELWIELRKGLIDLAGFEAENFYAIYSKIYGYISKEFDKQTQKNEIVPINEINRKALKLFSGSEASIPEIYYRLSEKYKHFLIDEFQDTNPAQWDGIHCFLKESIAEGGTLFYVGDRKQAIYDFRGADPRIFQEIKNYFSAYEFKENFLLKNFRSREKIVEFNNRIFSKENLEIGIIESLKKSKTDIDLGEILSVYESSKQSPYPSETGGYVEIVLADKTKDKTEEEDEEGDAQDDVKEIFLGFMDKIKDRFDFKDIAVLCPKNTQCQEAASWLSEKGYPFESAQNQSIKNNPTIKEIFSLLRFIASPIDKISFASFLLGGIFSKKTGMPVADLEKFLFENKTNDMFKSPYVDFRGGYPEIWKLYFEDFFSQAGLVAVYELAISILDKFDVLENFASERIFIMRFLELIKEFEKEDCGIRNFVDFFEDLAIDDEKAFIKTASGSGVQIMTIHKAKGLQFPIVILPFLSLSLKKMENPYFDVSGDEIELLKLTDGVKNLIPKMSDFYGLEKTKNFLSNLNALYVSMTRAKDEMYGIVGKKVGNSNNIAVHLLPLKDSNVIVYGEPVLKERAQESQTSKADAKEDQTGYLDMQSAFEFEGDYRDLSDQALKAKESGTIFHYALSRIKSLKNADLDLLINQTCDFTLKKFPLENPLWIKEELKEIFTVKEIRNIFDYDEEAVSNEKEIIDAFGQTMRMDKIIESDKEILIYDFKSGDSQNEANKKQLLRYKKNLSEISPQKTIRVFIVDLSQRKIIEIS